MFPFDDANIDICYEKTKLKMKKIENIILDYGNVIFMIDFLRAREAFMLLGIKNVDDFFGHAGQDALFDAFDKGKIDRIEFRNEIRRRTDSPALKDEQIDDAWNSLLIGVPEGKHEILEKLNANYRSFLLSNNNEIHYERCMKHIQEKYGVKDNSVFFEQTFYSHLMGMRKPDKEIFEKVVEETGIIPQQTLFVDDSPQHLATAKALGFHTELCTKELPLADIVKKWEL